MPRMGPLGEAMKAKIRQKQEPLAAELQETKNSLRAAHAEIQGKETAVLGAQQQLQAATMAAEAAHARELEVNAQYRALAEHTVALRTELQNAEGMAVRLKKLQAREADLNQEVQETQARLQVALFDAENANSSRCSLEARLEDAVHDCDAIRHDFSVELAAKSVELHEAQAKLVATIAEMENMRISEADLKAQQNHLAEHDAALRAELEAERRARARGPVQRGARSKSASRQKSKSKRKASKGAKRQLQNPLNLLTDSFRGTQGSSSSKESPRRGLVDEVLGEDHECCAEE